MAGELLGERGPRAPLVRNHEKPLRSGRTLFVDARDGVREPESNATDDASIGHATECLDPEGDQHRHVGLHGGHE